MKESSLGAVEVPEARRHHANGSQVQPREKESSL
jgi:hypothetical protein